MASTKVAMSRKQIGGEVPMVANEITDDCIYTGLFGSLDSARMAIVSDKLMELANGKQISLVIVDLGNVEAIDSSVAGHLVRLGNTLKLVGVKPIFCGITAELAKTMVTAGVNMGDYITVRDLKSALKVSLELSGYQLIKNDNTKVLI